MSNQRPQWYFTLSAIAGVSSELGTPTLFFTADIFSGAGRPIGGQHKHLANNTRGPCLGVTLDACDLVESYDGSVGVAVVSG